MQKNISYPKVLVISHNVFSKNTSMGKTLSTYFNNWDRERIAQVFFHAELPTNLICERYYKYTDKDALISLICRWKHGQILKKQDVAFGRNSSVDTGSLTSIYNFGRKRYPLVYIARDFIWKVSTWNSKHFNTWIKEFSPEVIFFASGDYSFSYRIAKTISKTYGIPLVCCCFDDYYLYNSNENYILGRLRHKYFMKTVYETFRESNSIFTISEQMSEAYSKMFNKRCFVLYTGAKKFEKCSTSELKNQIVYLGGITLNRNMQLLDIAEVLKSIKHPEIPSLLDVYSGETNFEIIKDLTEENGINYHGSVSEDEVKKIIQESMVVIHTESFDEDIKRRVKYSISTKIPDCLASGTCMLAYGPKDVASIEYLVDNNAAIVADSKEKLDEALRTVFLDAQTRTETIYRAKELAKKNHDLDKIGAIVKKVLNDAISS